MRVLIADDSVLLREGLALILADGGHEVVGGVGDGETLVSEALRLRPDVVVADIRMPPSHTDEGLRAATRIRRQWANAPILLLSQYVVAGYLPELLADGGGALGYLLKDRVLGGEQFLDAVQQVATGGTCLDPEVVARILGRRTGRPPLDRLTPREIETLTHMAQGKTNAAIAKAMFVTEKAVAKNVNNIFGKLQLAPSGDDNRRVIAVLQYLEATDPDTSPQPQATG